MVRKLTTLDLPHGALKVVGGILQDAGFTLGTVGGGYGEVEREGEISDEEVATLTQKMAAELFEFCIQDLPEDDEDDEVAGLG